MSDYCAVTILLSDQVLGTLVDDRVPKKNLACLNLLHLFQDFRSNDFRSIGIDT